MGSRGIHLIVALALSESHVRVASLHHEFRFLDDYIIEPVLTMTTMYIIIHNACFKKKKRKNSKVAFSL